VELFFDTSAIVPILIEEPHSEKAIQAWTKAKNVWAWRWLQVETEAALSRRKAPAVAWQKWHQVSAVFGWLDIDDRQYSQLRVFNRTLRLRAADAGHLYTFHLAVPILPELKLVCFDQEIIRAAEVLGLDCFSV